MSRVWETEKIFYDGDEYFEQLIKDIDLAQEYITVEMFIFRDDIIGKKLSSHLIQASKRGVKVQVIVDGVGSFSFFDKLHGVFLKWGILVKIFNPLPFYHPYYGKLTFVRKIQVLAARLWRLNRRNHRKIITIDNSILFTGSFNLTDKHTKFHKEAAWKDMGVRVTGDYVKFAVLNFKKIWKLRDYYRYKKQLKKTLKLNWRQSPLMLNQTLIMKRFFYKNFIDRVKNSRQRIWLMTPYFIPKRRLIRALGNAAQRGVDVRLLITQRSDVHFFRWLQYFYYDFLLKKGVKIYEYADSVLHAKNYIIDDYITIGSTNLNHRSFMHDLEVDIVIQEDENKTKNCEHFLQSIQSQPAITLESLKQRPFFDQLVSRILFIFKYWF
jgi:cardiolipin synthase A/B